MKSEVLDSLESRAKRALTIIREIDKLSMNLTKLGEIQSARFLSYESNAYIYVDQSELVFDLKKTYETSALQEIRDLEKELSEIHFNQE